MSLPVLRSRNERAEPVRWDPFDEFERFEQAIAGYFDALRQWPPTLGVAFRPLADVEELDDAYVVEIEVPGVKRDQLEIEVSGRRLTVRGERTERERTGILRRRERTVGRFHYEVTLPGDIDEESVEARLDEGVLTVRVPKPETERPRKIAVR
jgi:HSP20 family protein